MKHEELSSRVSDVYHELHSRIGQTIDAALVDRWVGIVLELVDHSISIETSRINIKLNLILARLSAITRKETHVMATIKDIQDQANKALAAIENESSKDDAIIALVTANTEQITSLKDQLATAIANGNDPAELQAVLDSLTVAETSALANADKVVTAVNANTPSNTPPTP